MGGLEDLMWRRAKARSRRREGILEALLVQGEESQETLILKEYLMKVLWMEEE